MMIQDYEYYSNVYKINNILPETIYNPNAKISFVYVYTPNINGYATHSILNILKYAEKYNYGVIIYNNVFNNIVSPCWNKIAAIIKNLYKHEYLVWIDADALINNFDITLESIIKTNPNVDLHLCWDIDKEKECINSGVMIIKNTKWSINLFNKIWNNPYPHGHNDQNIVLYEIVKEIYPNSKPSLKYSDYCTIFSHPNVHIYSENTFNCNIYNFNYNDFILHLMGVSEKNRINIMRQINTKLGLDNYSNTDCLDILKLENDANREENIDKICLHKKPNLLSIFN